MADRSWVPWVAGGVVLAGVSWWAFRKPREITVTPLPAMISPITLAATVTNKRAGATDMRVGDAIIVTAEPSPTSQALEFRVVATKPGGATFSPCPWTTIKMCAFALDLPGTWTVHVEARVAGTTEAAVVSSETPFTVSASNGTLVDQTVGSFANPNVVAPLPAGSFAVMDAVDGVLGAEDAQAARGPEGTPVDFTNLYIYRPPPSRGINNALGSVWNLIPPIAPQVNPGTAVPART